MIAASTPARPRIQIVEVGEFHGSDIPLTKGGSTWLGLFPNGDGFAWRETVLHLRYDRDEVAEDPPNVLSGKLLFVSEPVAPVFLIRGLPGLSTATVKTIWQQSDVVLTDGRSLVPRADTRFELNAVQYRLEVLNPHPGEGGELGKAASLVLHANDKSQTIYSLPNGGNDASWEMRWVGDLDGDGKLDLYLSLSDHYNVDQRILFLSSQARSGELVRAVASFHSTGC